MLRGRHAVTVNAAFLREIKEDNERLRKLLADVCELCTVGSAGRTPVRRFASLLIELRDQFALHFTLEEAYGYFENPVVTAPHLSERAETLRREHADLYEDIRRLSQEAENVSSRNGNSDARHRLAGRFLEFYDRLQDHERRENELIVQAYNVDLGVGD